MVEEEPSYNYETNTTSTTTYPNSPTPPTMPDADEEAVPYVIAEAEVIPESSITPIATPVATIVQPTAPPYNEDTVNNDYNYSKR